MVHKQSMEYAGIPIGELFENDEGGVYTAILAPSMEEDELRTWWEQNMYGDFDITHQTIRGGMTCLRLEPK